jgi:hypothetical protein
MKRKHVLWGTLALLVLIAIPTLVFASGKSDLATIRKATARYQRLDVAEEDGFVQFFECIDKPSEGAMGTHYIMPDRFDDQLTLEEPEVLVYDVDDTGKAKLVAVEYVIPAAAWSGAQPPTFLGQTLAYKTTMGPHELDPYYEVHVWVWRHNPSGMYADWNPRVTCPAS